MRPFPLKACECRQETDSRLFAGTAVEITPIRSVDRIQIAAGGRGPMTESLQQAFFGIISGERPDRHGWLTYVDGAPA